MFYKLYQAPAISMHQAHVCAGMCVYVCMYLRMCVCTYVRTYVCMYVCMHACMDVFVSLCASSSCLASQLASCVACLVLCFAVIVGSCTACMYEDSLFMLWSMYAPQSKHASKTHSNSRLTVFSLFPALLCQFQHPHKCLNCFTFCMT